MKTRKIVTVEIKIRTIFLDNIFEDIILTDDKGIVTVDDYENDAEPNRIYIENVGIIEIIDYTTCDNFISNEHVNKHGFAVIIFPDDVEPKVNEPDDFYFAELVTYGGYQNTVESEEEY